jgi:hypothetical protein
MWTGANTDMALNAFLVLNMTELSDFFCDLNTHRADRCTFIVAAGAWFRLPDFMRCELFKPAEPQPESTDTTAEGTFAKKKNQNKAAGKGGHANKHDRAGNT